jgi:VWFA-related protein
MKKTVFRLSFATLLLVAVSTLGAQDPPASRPGGEAQQQGQEVAQQRPTFRVAIELVTTDVFVRDPRGQFVADLSADDFEVFEDGVKQDLASMTLVHGGRVFNPLAPPPRPVEEGIILPPARPTSDAAGRIFILFVDDLHMDFRNTGRIRELFKTIRTTLIHEGDMFGVVSTGPSSLAIDLTYDHRRLDEAIKRISGAGLKPTEILEAPITSQGPSEVRYRAHVAFSTAYELIQQLEKVTNRRKAFIYVSNGYDFNPFEEGRIKADEAMRPRMEGEEGQQNLADPWSRQGQQFADADLARELSELTRAANRANVTMYTIDPRGLVGGPDLDEQVDMVEWQNYVRKSQDSLRVVAEQTGGIAVVNQNDFGRALKRIDAETSDYYVLGYYSKNPDPLHRHRQIEVKVNRPGLSVMGRTSYSLKPPPKPVIVK